MSAGRPSGTCTKFGSRMKVENIENPITSVVTLVAAISRRANVARSTSGSGTRFSISTQTVNSTAEAASSAEHADRRPAPVASPR